MRTMLSISLLIQIYQFKIRFEYKSQQDRQYNIFFEKVVDACSVLNDTKALKENPISDYIMKTIKTYLDEKHIHPCPYEMEEIVLEPKNLIGEKLVHGIFRSTYQMSNKKDPNIVTMIFESLNRKLFQ